MTEVSPVTRINPYGYAVNVGSRETGLSPGQTGGNVGETYVTRPSGTPVDRPYYETRSQAEMWADFRKNPEGYQINTRTGEIARIGQTGGIITGASGYVSPSTPSRYQQTDRDFNPVFSNAPTPFQTGQVQYAPGSLFGTGYFTSPEYQRQQQYPSTPIDYSRTHVSELYSFPLYQGASFVSRGLQAGLEFGVEAQPLPSQVKEVQKGFGSMFTGIPEFFASGLSGWEYAAREPKVFKEGLAPSLKIFGAGLAEQATTRPFYTAGQAAGLFFMMKGTGAKQTKLLEAPKTEPFKAPARQLLPQVPKGMEGLEVLRLPEGSGMSKPVVIEGVKTIKTVIPEQYRAALERGAASFAERGVMGLQFGSKGYRPSGVPKAANIFTTGEFKKFLKEEKAVSYVPTFERMRVEPQIKPRVQVMTAEKTYVLPSLRNLQVVKTAPKTSLKIAVLPKTSTRSAIMTDILVQTKPKTLTQTMTRLAPRTATKVKPITQTIVKPSTATSLKILPSVQTRTAVKELTQTKTKTATRTQTATILDVKKTTKTKIKDPFKNLKVKTGFGRKGFKFPELSGVAAPKQIFKGFRL